MLSSTTFRHVHRASVKIAHLKQEIAKALTDGEPEAALDEFNLL
ncbi:MAG: hypothetical protein RMK18_05600 [Armatimonadota bacterium]|nr:hypothetical protein [Armatimonadota bacterium]MCX7777787.1 hypothetical protein [Armatimonadota bacterium]MDW8025326.1 hypothetical protein [Armatimonadota bacterium]